MNAYLPEQIISPGFHSSQGERVALLGVEVDVAFHNLLCRSTVTQRYANREDKAIEAVYTFPLASGSVLLDLVVTIGNRRLEGMVVEKKVAEEQYEEALADGEGAIMLEHAAPGLYTMSVGNILPGEEVTITYGYVELHVWKDGNLRFHLPTTIAPRYGSPESAGLQPHQVPEQDLFAENNLQLTLRLFDVLATAVFDCLSHRICVEQGHVCSVVTLAGGTTAMDRDFVLNIRQPSEIADMVTVEHDATHGITALATFTPQIPAPEIIPAKSVKIVVDCSGSMNGDSITQARQAISDCLLQLRSEDFFNLVAFGNSHKAYFPNQVPANPENITTIRRALRSLAADMGGTEMESALRATVALPGPPIPQDILLITDGQIWQGEELLAMIKKANHRVFAVGVGSAVSETFIRQLAMETGGACEFVVPNEDMAEKITRHFRRIFLPRATAASVFWPDHPRETIPKDPGSIFAGDTVHAFARYSNMPTGQVRLELTLADANISTHSAILTGKALPDTPTTMMNSAGGDLARLAAAWAIEEADPETARQLAITYQLISPFTNFLVVDQRPDEQKSRELPLLLKTPQMLAAGWGGAGSVTSSQDVRFSMARPSACVDEPSVMYSPTAQQRENKIFFSVGMSQEEKDRKRQQTTPSSFMYKCERHNGRGTTWWKAELQLTTYDDLLACDLPDHILDALTDIEEQMDPIPSEALVVLAFLLVLHETAQDCRFNRTTARTRKKARKKLKPSQALLDRIRNVVPNIRREDWGRSVLSLDEPEIDWDGV